MKNLVTLILLICCSCTDEGLVNDILPVNKEVSFPTKIVILTDNLDYTPSDEHHTLMSNLKRDFESTIIDFQYTKVEHIYDPKHFNGFDNGDASYYARRDAYKATDTLVILVRSGNFNGGRAYRGALFVEVAEGAVKETTVSHEVGHMLGLIHQDHTIMAEINIGGGHFTDTHIKIMETNAKKFKRFIF